jgi:hypothetical protein
MGGPLERAILNVDESLDRPNAALSSVGGSFDASGFVSCFRRLGLSLRLDVDGVYYVSFLVRRPQAHPMSVVGITLKPHEDPRQRPDSMQRLVLGVNGSNEVYARLGKFGTRASLPLTGGATYLLIAKIVASRLSADQVYLRIYGPRETIETMEPASWTVVTPPFQSELAFDWLGVSINSKNRQVLDEIRVGTTWTSVTAPWLTLKGN